MSGGDPDGRLLDELRSLLERADPVPPEVTEFARAASDWRRLDAELAELLADSALETPATARTRATGTASRWLTFRAGELAIDLEVATDGETRVLLGQLTPAPGAAAVELQGGDGSTAATTEADSLGRFRLTVSVSGRVRLRVVRRDPAAPPVETSWLSL